MGAETRRRCEKAVGRWADEFYDVKIVNGRTYKGEIREMRELHRVC